MEEQTRSLSEVAGLMGVSERTVRRWIKSGRLKAYKPGRDYRIPESGLQAFVEESEISPKVPAPLSQQPSFNDVLAEEQRATTDGYDLSATARPDYIESVEAVGRPLVAALDFPTTQMRELGKGQREYVKQLQDENGLPKDLPFEEVIAHLQRMKMFLYWYRFLTWQLSRENFSAVVHPWYERLATGAPVPKDIQHAIRDLEAAWNALEEEAVPLTLKWVDRERHRNAANALIARISADMDQLLEEQRASKRDMLIRQ